MNCNDAHRLHQLYLDRELDPADIAAVEEHLGDCAACRAACERAHAFSTAIRRDVHRYQAPLELRDAVSREIGRRERRSLSSLRYLTVGWNPIALAASLMLAVATSSALTAVGLSTASTEDQMVQEVVSSHVRSLQANHLTDVASSDQHTVKPWFTGKIDTSPPAIDLASAGFPLIGGRLDYVDQRPCAVLVYRHEKHVINVIVWADQGGDKTPVETYSRQGYNLVRFNEDEMSFWAVSDLNRAELSDFANRLGAAAHNPDGMF
jgi:anti-sigma factor RsiW